ncbi:MAG TPA: hypothetical protein VKQ71_05230, partial [Acidimicrobiales bacterium]|nr:hypothetical protein [Acidimicrobiales bacterium]
MTIAVTARRGATFIPAAADVALRTLRKFARTPQLIVVGTIQGAMFLLIFRYVFGGAIAAGGLRYVDFLVPGFVTTGVLFTGNRRVGRDRRGRRIRLLRPAAQPPNPQVVGDRRAGPGRHRDAGVDDGGDQRHRLRRRVPSPRRLAR